MGEGLRNGIKTDAARRLELVVATLMVIAGMLHVAAGPEHFSEWWGYGLFFLASALAQTLLGLLLATQGISLSHGGWEGARRLVYKAGIVGNLLIFAMWVVTRTVGIPVGPLQGVVEPFGLLDGATKVAEAVAILLLFALLRHVPRRNKELTEAE